MNPLRDHERFKNICAGFQSLALGIAVIVGGIWAAYVFNAEQRVTHARLTAERMELENRLAAEKASEKYLTTELQIEQVEEQGDSWRILKVTLGVGNPGYDTVWLVLEGEPLIATRVSVGENGNKKYGPTFSAPAVRITQQGELVRLKTLYVGSGRTETIQFLVAVDKPGLYLVGYSSADLNNSTHKDLIGGGAKRDWGAFSFFNVK